MGGENFDINHQFSQPDEYNMDEFTLLHLAASWCTDEKVVQALLDKGAKVNMQDRCGETPLHQAVVFNKTEIVKALLAVKGIDVNVQDRYGKTPLHKVDIFTNTEIREALLKAGADPDVKSFLDKTPRYKDEENNQIATKAIKTGIAFGAIAALAVGIVAGGITYAVLKPSNKLDEPDSNKVASVAHNAL